MAEEKTPKFRRLGRGGDIYGWQTQIETWFRSKGCWNHVLNNEDVVPLNDEEEIDMERISSKCKSDLLQSLYPDVSIAVRHLQTPQEMYQRIMKMFVGTEIQQRRKLRDRLANLEPRDNFFSFINQFESAVSQLAVLGGVLSYQDISLLFFK